MDQAESSTNDDLDVLISELEEDVACEIMSFAEKLVTSYNESRRIEDLQRGISELRDALAVCPPASPARGAILGSIATALISRYEELGDVDDLKVCIALNRDALYLRPQGDPHRSTFLNNLASALRTRYTTLGNAEDLEECIAMHREALTLCPPAHANHLSTLNNLALALNDRYRKLGNAEDLEEGIALSRDALDLCPPGHTNRASLLNDLASALQIRYDKFGNTEDLEICIGFYREALGLRPPGHPYRFACLNNLGAALKTRYEKLGNAEDLEDCISLNRDGLDLCPPGHKNRASLLNSLANALQIRYDKFGNTEDLEICIGFYREALGLRPPGHPYRLACLNNLGAALNTCYEKFGNANDLEDSVAFHREALSLCPPSHPDLPALLSSLAITLHIRYDKLGNSDDLEDCIALNRDALCLCPPGHPDRFMTLTNLAIALRDRYDKLSTPEDLDECITCYHETVDLHADGHPNLSRALYQLGQSLILRYIRMPKPEDLVRALDNLILATYDSTSYIHHRLGAAILWIIYARASDHESIFEAYTALLQLINRSLIFRPNVELQQRFLASTAIPRSLASDAASAAIEAGKIELAVEFLEQGRALLWSRVDAYKYPLHELRQVKGGEELANRLEVVSSKLESLSLMSSSATSNQESSTKAAILDAQMKEHRIRSEEWENLVKKVREIDGFGHFLGPAPFSILRTAAAEGPVILVNISEHRSDAIVVVKDRPPELVELLNLELNALRLQKLGTTKEIEQTLFYLWKNIVSPIVDRLEELEIPKQSRIWWCPTAELCALPLHAAWQPGFKDKPKRDLHDEYISSYTPTLSSLIRARSTVIQPPTIPKLLVVGHPSETEKLEMVDDEVRVIQELGRARSLDVTVLDEDKANCQAVLKTLTDHSWAHFACHGHLGEESQPFRASFELHDAHLPLLDIIQAKVPNAEFAFLSACNSAAGDLSTPDESIHLSAALQFCGFRSVVGTLWKMDDEDGPTICKKFYKHMFRNPDKMDFRDAAFALNQAIKQMKKGKNRVPLDRLVLFVHIGA